MDEQTIDQMLNAVRQTGGEPCIHSASAPNGAPGWSVEITCEPKGQVRSMVMGNAPPEVIEMFQSVLSARDEQQNEEQPDLDAPEATHMIQIKVFDTDLGRGVRRCTEAFLAAYAASISSITIE